MTRTVPTGQLTRAKSGSLGQLAQSVHSMLVRPALKTAGRGMSILTLIVCVFHHTRDSRLLILTVSVSAVWNMYRKIHLMVLDIMLRCLHHLGSTNVRPREQLDAQNIAEAMAASIPFHLTADAHVYVQQVQAGAGNMVPGRPVGGLLMLHPLHMAMGCTAVSPELRDYMGNRLQWIGRTMGIGQATLLGDVSVLRCLYKRLIDHEQHSLHLPCHYIAEGHLLIWTGMMIAPP